MVVPRVRKEVQIRCSRRNKRQAIDGYRWRSDSYIVIGTWHELDFGKKRSRVESRINQQNIIIFFKFINT